MSGTGAFSFASAGLTSGDAVVINSNQQ
jgi:hypothetical protein